MNRELWRDAGVALLILLTALVVFTVVWGPANALGLLWWLAWISAPAGLVIFGWWGSYRLSWVMSRPTWNDCWMIWGLCLSAGSAVKQYGVSVAEPVIAIVGAVVATGLLLGRRWRRLKRDSAESDTNGDQG
jgi:hypothetical protein